MAVLLIALAAGVGFMVAYHTYGRWLGSRIFQLSAQAVCPSVRLRDDRDYVPTHRSIVFGHHFTSIAGTGPIVGPAIAVMWGWLPALLWVILGSIFIGAVHDLGALVVSLRNSGQTVGDIAGRVLNRRVRLLFLIVLFMALTVVLAIFGLVIAAVFRQYPAAILPCLVQIPMAIAIGLYLHRRGVSLLVPSVIALGLMYLTVAYGDVGVLHTVNLWLAGLPLIVWVAVLLIYSYIASVIPVWVLLQPRDYINSLQLLSALGLIVLGLVVAATMSGPAPTAALPEADPQPLRLVAPMIQWSPADAPMIFPFLFITIACGAISGFHCLVSSGTSSKQLQSEADARFVGFGSMLTEGFLATLVILACVAGVGLGLNVLAQRDGGFIVRDADAVAHRIFRAEDGRILRDSNGVMTELSAGARDAATGAWVALDDAGALAVTATGASAWRTQYASWLSADGLGAKVGAFVGGAANFLRSIGLPAAFAVAFMGVLVASFAATTLDTACRLQRYVVQELATALLPTPTRDASDATAMNEAAHALFQRRTIRLTANPITWLTNKHGATLFAVAIGGALATLPMPGAAWNLNTAGTGGMILWPLFGATNQFLGGLAFLVIAFYLWRRNKPVFFIIPPLLFMLVMPAWAMLLELPKWLSAEQPNVALITIAIATLALEAWMIVEALLMFPRVRGVMEEADPLAAPVTG